MNLVLFASSYVGLTVVCVANGLSIPPTKTRSKTTSYATKKRTFLRQLDILLTKLQNPQDQLKDHVYLSGNYAPVSEEHTRVPVQVVAGKIPRHIDGMLCRNGPNPTNFLSKRYHWFDGHAMLHNLRFENGNAFYTNQFVPSIRYEVESELQEDFFPTLGEYDGIFGLFKILFHPAMVKEVIGEDYGLISCPPNTACLMYRNKFYCLNEANVPFECRLLPDGRMEGVGYEFFHRSLDYPISAHPRIDSRNGDLLFHSYTVNTVALKRDGPIKVGRFSAKHNKVESYFCPTDKSYISFAHNLLCTRDYIIVYDCSNHFDPQAMIDGGSYFQFKADYNLRFGVMPKTATSRDEVTWYDAGRPGSIVHPLNSWQEDGTIVIWTPLCDELVLDLESDNLNVFNMTEFRIDTTTGVVTHKVVDDSVNVEFSVVPTFGEFTRYGYTAIQDASTPGEGSFAGFCVWDMKEQKLHATVYYENGEVGGEPMLIQSNDRKMSYVGVYLQKGEESSFALYDGESSKVVARLKMPSRVPFGFHGLYINGDELRDHFEYHNNKISTETEQDEKSITQRIK